MISAAASVQRTTISKDLPFVSVLVCKTRWFETKHFRIGKSTLKPPEKFKLLAKLLEENNMGTWKASVAGIKLSKDEFIKVQTLARQKGKNQLILAQKIFGCMADEPRTGKHHHQNLKKWKYSFGVPGLIFALKRCWSEFGGKKVCIGPTKSFRLTKQPYRGANVGVIEDIHSRKYKPFPKNGDAPDDLQFRYNDGRKNLVLNEAAGLRVTLRPCEVKVTNVVGHFIVHDVIWPSTHWCSGDDKDEYESDEED